MMNKYNIEVKLVSGTDYCVELAPIEIMAEHKTDVYEKIKQGFEAVERMTPKKPIQDEHFQQDYICSCCGGKLAESVDDNCCLEEEMAEWCPFCGQALDWSE